MSLGTSIAYFASIVLLILTAKSPVSSTTSNATYFDSVVFLTLFVIAGRYIEAFSRRKTADAVTELKKLRPTEALLLDENGRTEAVSADLLEVGDRVLVTPGSSPPTDGTVIAGSTNFDESSLTGEARLVSKGIGERVFGGTINRGQVITLSVGCIRGQSM
jgi:P-type Cu+ transporter